MSGGYWSREQRLARLGREVYELGLKEAAAAPPPGPAQIELMRRLFAPLIERRVAERQAPKTRVKRAA